MPKLTNRFKTRDSKPELIHKKLSREINRTRAELQRKADNKYGKNKVRITKVYASKVVAGRLRK